MKRFPSHSIPPRRTLAFLVAAAVFAWVTSVQAHPGHGPGDGGVVHYLASPSHAGWLALVGVALWLGARQREHGLSRRLLRGAGLVAILAAFLVLGVRA